MSALGNPRSWDEAEHEYYLVPSAMKLRYPPQYAEIRMNDLMDAKLAQYALRKRGVKYKIYDRYGQKVKGTKSWK